MNNESQVFGVNVHKLAVAHPGPVSIEDLLRHVDPAPDEETEFFVAAIYADRRTADRRTAAVAPPPG
jgi:hypothetical protein